AFVRLRSIARHGLTEPDAGELRLSPGFGRAGEVACEVARVAFFVRYSHLILTPPVRRSEQEATRSVLIVAWQSAPSAGRHWMESLLRDVGAKTDDVLSGLSQLGPVRNLSVSDLNGLWSISNRALEAADLSQLDSLPGKAFGLSEYVALTGLCEVFGLADGINRRAEHDQRPEMESWHQIEMIADTCHRLPLAWDYPAWSANMAERKRGVQGCGVG